MFDDLDQQDGYDVDWDHASDREVLHGIWTRLETGDMDGADGWAALYERYPNEPRYLFLLTWNQVTFSMGIPLDAFLRVAERLAAVPALREPLIDLVSLARDVHRSALTGANAAAFEALAAKLDGARRDPEDVTERLRTLEDRILQECHDRTLGGRPLAPKIKPAEAKLEDWATLVSRAKDREEKPYSATAVYNIGDKVRHPSFGVGIVTAKREKKIDLLFEQGRRTLVGR